MGNPYTPQSLNGDSDQARYEIKCCMELSALGFLKNWAAVHPAGFTAAFSERRVNNIYFDTFEYQSLAENATGLSQRRKIRLRWYGNAADIHAAGLEIKKRRNRMGTKQRYAIELTPPLFHQTYRELQRNIRSQIPEEARILFAAAAEPVMINDYIRQYLVSRDGRIRLTLDSDIHVYDQRFSRRPRKTMRVNIPETIVLECKFMASDWGGVQHLLKDLPGRVTRSSKYAMGLESMLI